MKELQTIIENQKKELENLHTQPFNPRHKEEFLNMCFNQKSIKVIIGPRRAGKSTLAIHFIKNKKFAYLNFDDKNLADVKEHVLLDATIQEVYGDIDNYFLDEIQNLQAWEFWANTLHRRGKNVIITGSNAKLLSTELSTHLTGRYIEIEVLPFSAREYDGDFYTFYKLGGYPDILLNNQNHISYLEGLQNSIILKDIVARYNIRNYNNIVALFEYIKSNCGCIINYKRLEPHFELAEKTIKKYIGYLTDAYLCFELLPFSYKAKEYYRSNKKIYLIDNNFIKSEISEPINNAKKLENFVFLELMKLGLKPNRDLFYYKTKNNLEVDFVIKKDFKITTAIQVSYNIDNINTKDREFKALKKTSVELMNPECMIVTWNTNYEEDKVKVVGVKEFVEWVKNQE